MADRERMTSRSVPKAVAGAVNARIWVLDDPRTGTSAQAIGIAERLGVAFRRVPLSWNWMAHVAALAPNGSLLGLAPSDAAQIGMDLPAGIAPPLLVISSGRRSAAVALWLKARFGAKLVHCMSPGIGGLLRRAEYDLLVTPEHDLPAAAPNVFPVLGTLHRVSPNVLRQAALQWSERLDHLPHPKVALLVGGPTRGRNLEPARAHTLGRTVARLVAGRSGSVLASTSRRTGAEAGDALAAGLGQVMHLLYRWSEPGENPYLGYLVGADAIIVTADSVSMISEACATSAAVFIALPELAGTRHRHFIGKLTQAGQVRPLGRDLAAWNRTPLDEAGRVAAEIRRRFQLDDSASSAR